MQLSLGKQVLQRGHQHPVLVCQICGHVAVLAGTRSLHVSSFLLLDLIPTPTDYIEPKCHIELGSSSPPRLRPSNTHVALKFEVLQCSWVLLKVMIVLSDSYHSYCFLKCYDLQGLYHHGEACFPSRGRSFRQCRSSSTSASPLKRY